MKAATDADGRFVAKVRLPKDVETGAHQVVAGGVDPGGIARVLRSPLAVAALSGGPDVRVFGLLALGLAITTALAVLVRRRTDGSVALPAERI